MSELIHIIYNSAASVEFTEDDLTTLLQRARSKNASLGITGMLLFVEGTFFQVLEGDASALDALYETIAADPRHERITQIIREPIRDRSFSEWTMGFSSLSRAEAGAIDGLNDFFHDGLVLDDMDRGRAKRLLTAFREGRWRVNPARRVQTATVPELTAADPGAAIAPRPRFTFAFQPIVDVATGQVAGYEALIRGSEFESASEVLAQVPAAEAQEFDEDARRMATAQAALLGATGRLHLNFLLGGVESLQTIASTIETAQRCGIEPERLMFEINQEASISSAATIARHLDELRRQGFGVSIDDFGMGNAGLTLLEIYQPNAISLNMNLVRGIDTRGPRQAILRGLRLTCDDLGIDVIAKGVETDEEFRWLQGEGFQLFQGFLFGRPALQALPTATLPSDVAPQSTASL